MNKIIILSVIAIVLLASVGAYFIYNHFKEEKKEPYVTQPTDAVFTFENDTSKCFISQIDTRCEDKQK